MNLFKIQKSAELYLAKYQTKRSGKSGPEVDKPSLRSRRSFSAPAGEWKNNRQTLQVLASPGEIKLSPMIERRRAEDGTVFSRRSREIIAINHCQLYWHMPWVADFFFRSAPLPTLSSNPEAKKASVEADKKLIKKIFSLAPLMDGTARDETNPASWKEIRFPPLTPLTRFCAHFFSLRDKRDSLCTELIRRLGVVFVLFMGFHFFYLHLRLPPAYICLATTNQHPCFVHTNLNIKK